ncbi:phosphoenolpyruvate--protein phosphotransferase [Fervidobacterium pennivorans subsp. shakshaketiis]|uniref:phosphoenolpyruvate--protein phosphotransferase n=1 Tax=Fervidobacterium TaxID=2422 RepID=UPI00355BC3A4
MRLIKGIPCSSGIAIGKVWVWVKKTRELSYKGNEAKSVWENAKKTLKNELTAKLNDLSETEKDLVMFYLLLLDDPNFEEYFIKKIDEGLDFKSAIETTAEKFEQEFLNLDVYFKMRAQDIEALKEEIFRVVTGESYPYFSEPQILVSKEMTPWQIINVPKDKLLGLVSEKGGVLSHLSIIARNLNIPLIVGAKISEISSGELAILDGERGLLILDPSPQDIKKYQKTYESYTKVRKKSLEYKNFVPKKENGEKFYISANIGNLEDAFLALEQGAMGIGLFRTEFLFLERNEPPSEEEQYQIYKKVGDLFPDYPVIIRTLDIGGDKNIPYVRFEKEENPFLGLRGIRWSLHEKELFKTQLRAIMRASYDNNIHMMFPMVDLVEEVIEAKKIVEEVAAELEREGKKYRVPPTGIMLETPISILNIKRFAPLVNFYSLGTNDLFQYTFAVDRTNEMVSYLYRPYHPAFWKLIKDAIDFAHEAGKWIGICGELGGDLKAFLLLYSLGIDEVSVAPLKIPTLKFLSSKMPKIDVRLETLNENELLEVLDKQYQEITEELLNNS